jgi:hypothetical protein
VWLAQLRKLRPFLGKFGAATHDIENCTGTKPSLPRSLISVIMFAARQLSLARPVAGRRLFHATAPTLVKVGDKLPNVELMENSPGNKVNIAEELKSGKGLIIGKPPVDADHIQDRSLINELLLIRYRI